METARQTELRELVARSLIELAELDGVSVQQEIFEMLAGLQAVLEEIPLSERTPINWNDEGGIN